MTDRKALWVGGTKAMGVSSIVMLRVKCAIDHHGSQRALAEKIGCSEAYLSDMLNGRREWSEDLLKHVGVERYTAYHDRGKPGWMKP